MEWPHDPDGEAGSEGRRKYGLAIFAKKVDGDDFPLSREACLESFGDDPIRIDADRVIPARDVLELLEEGPYVDKTTWLAALGAAMREGEYWSFERDRYEPHRPG